MKLALSTGAVKDHDIKTAAQIANESGLDAIEIILQDEKHELDVAEINKIKETCNLEISFIHAPFVQPKLLAYYFSPKKVAEPLLKISFETAEKVGAKGVVVHPFPSFFTLNDEKINWIMTDIIKHQQSDGILVAMENLEERKVGPICVSPYCIRTVDELYKYVQEHDYHITLDTAHCSTYGINPAEFFEKCHDRIMNIHLSDYENYQCHYPVGEKTINFEEFFAMLVKYDYQGYVCLETDPQYQDKIPVAVKRIKEWTSKCQTL